MITQGAMVQFQGYLTRLDAKSVRRETALDEFRFQCGLAGLDVAEELEAARSWIEECGTEEEDAEDLAYAQIARYVARMHVGGIKGWIEVSIAGADSVL